MASKRKAFVHLGLDDGSGGFGDAALRQHAVAVAGLTVGDMVKAVDKHAVITDIRVEAKSGGRSGDWVRVS